MTRPDDGGRFAGLLAEAGFQVVETPLTRIAAPSDPEPLRAAARRLARQRAGGELGYEVLLLTSARAVRALAAVLESPSGTGVPGLEVWVVGSSTAREARRHGFAPDRMPRHFTGAALLEEAPAWRSLPGTRILFPRARHGWKGLRQGLEDRGARVDLVPAYRIEADPVAADRLVEAVMAREVDGVPLTAGSAAESLAAALHRAGRPSWPREVPVVAIGPATRTRAEAMGIPVRAAAVPHTLHGLVNALRRVLDEG